jgi:transposase InsO family protein
VILDVFSRYAVGWTVQHRENGQLAKALIEQATERGCRWRCTGDCAFRDAEVREQERDGLGALRGAAIGVQREHLGRDLLLLGGLLDQPLASWPFSRCATVQPTT